MEFIQSIFFLALIWVPAMYCTAKIRTRKRKKSPVSILWFVSHSLVLVPFPTARSRAEWRRLFFFQLVSIFTDRSFSILRDREKKNLQTKTKDCRCRLSRKWVKRTCCCFCIEGTKTFHSRLPTWTCGLCNVFVLQRIRLWPHFSFSQTTTE